MGFLGTTWALMRASWNVVRNNKRLLVLPVLSSICLVLVVASFVAPLFLEETNRAVVRGELPAEQLSLGHLAPPEADSPPADKIRFGLVVFAFYFANYFVIVFFNSAIVASALFWMRDGDSSLSRGLRAALARLPQIAGWALLSATVGLLLRALESNKKGSRLVASLLGTAWTVMTYLAVPVLVVEGTGPFGALKGSVSLLRRSWGSQLVGGFGFGIVWFLLSLLGLGIVAGGAWAASATGNAAFLGLAGLFAAIYFVGLVLVSSVLTPVFQAALYVYAKEGRTPGSFGQELLRGAFRPGA